jgi:hypothetical protein
MSGSNSQPLVGYPGLVWATCYQAMSWLYGILNTNSASAQTITNGALVTYATLRNGSTAVAAYQTAQVLNNEAQNLIAIQDMVLPLGPAIASYFNNRVVAVQAAASGIAALTPVVQPYAASGLLAAGSPAITDSRFLEWCMGFDTEIAPTTVLLASGVYAAASGCASAWFTVVNAIQVAEGTPYLDYRYDTAQRMYRNCLNIADTILGFQSGPYAAITSSNAQYVWNSAVALPTILMDAACLMSAPFTLGQQQASVVRYDLDSVALELSQLLLSLRQPNSASPGLATLNVGQSLQDLAAIQTGNLENWPTIAALNNISPPYPGGANTSLSLSNNNQLVLPSANSNYTSGSPAPSYAANVLGTDWDFGPVNGVQPQWLGDIPLITGYQNFARAIGRRLQTPIGTLIYHPTYGSRIPPEVGAVQGANEAAKLAQLGKSAINQDPRTGSVVSAQASVQPGALATFAATILPIGPGANSVQVNEVISPL